MSAVKDYIESGILEQYVLGHTSAEETAMVRKMSAEHEEVRLALDDIQDVMESYALANAVTPPPTIKPFLLASVDFAKRMQNGEQPSLPPTLHTGSKKADYTIWLERPDMTLPEDFEHFYARIIGHTPQETTAIVWIEHLAPEELHHDEYEKFLVLEGTCDIVIGTEVHALVPGDFLAIPLHKTHEVRVTSDEPCKVILQRTAA